MTKLYIGNLSFGMTDDSLQQLFLGRKGYQVSSARVITDRETGRSAVSDSWNLDPAMMRLKRSVN